MSADELLIKEMCERNPRVRELKELLKEEGRRLYDEEQVQDEETLRSRLRQFAEERYGDIDNWLIIALVVVIVLMLLRGDRDRLSAL